MSITHRSKTHMNLDRDMRKLKSKVFWAAMSIEDHEYDEARLLLSDISELARKMSEPSPDN